MHQIARPQIISPKRQDASFDTDGCAGSKRSRLCEHNPTEGDVLFYGDTKLTCTHPGNQIFANLIKKSVREMNGTETIENMAQLLVKCFATYDRPMNFFIWCQESNKLSQLSAAEVLFVTNHALRAEANMEQGREAELTFNTNEQTPIHEIPPSLDSDNGTLCKSAVTDAMRPSGHGQHIQDNSGCFQDVFLSEPEMIDTSAWDAFSPYIIGCLVTALDCNQSE